jgi:hypothetical protein
VQTDRSEEGVAEIGDVKGEGDDQECEHDKGGSAEEKKEARKIHADETSCA